MYTSLLINTEDINKLKNVLNLVSSNLNIGNVKLLIHAKGYEPWANEELLQIIKKFSEYYVFPTQKNKIESILDLVFLSKTESILILDEGCEKIELTKWNINDFTSLYFDKKELLQLKLDTKYKTLYWFIIDTLSQKLDIRLNIEDQSEDYSRYKQKTASKLFKEKIIYIDGGIGDHILALPLLEKLSKDIFICSKYPFVYEHLKVKGHIHWDDNLFGGYIRSVYEHGSASNSKSIIDSFFGVYGYDREEIDELKYNGGKDKNIGIETSKKIALICSSAAKINNQDSNKDWKDIRWFKLVNFLQKLDYAVVQVGTKSDNQIPNVDFKFLDQSIDKLSFLVDICDMWISVDTFFHHFAASIKPSVGICITPFYNDHAKHKHVKYIEKDCGKNFFSKRWWLDLQQPERKECMDLIELDDVISLII